VIRLMTRRGVNSKMLQVNGKYWNDSHLKNWENHCIDNIRNWLDHHIMAIMIQGYWWTWVKRFGWR
jgi:hypothetical protein